MSLTKQPMERGKTKRSLYSNDFRIRIMNRENERDRDEKRSYKKGEIAMIPDGEEKKKNGKRGRD